MRCVVVSAEGASSAVLAPPLPYLHVLLHRHAVLGESGSGLSSSGSALLCLCVSLCVCVYVCVRVRVCVMCM